MNRPADGPTPRQQWLAVLARAPRAALARVAQPVLAGCEPRWLRPPETGLLMLRGRIGGSGDRFNLGEATVTRCVARCLAADGTATAGVGWVLGRDTERATWVAQLDALLQQRERHAELMARVIAPLAAERAAADAAEQARIEASRVRFHTLQPDAAT